MDSYINFVVELENAKERLRKSIESIPEQNANGGCAGRTRPLTQLDGASLELIVWMVSCLLIILGSIQAGESGQPLFWLAIWPFPVALACTVFIFIRQGVHFESGVLVLGRGRVGVNLTKGHSSS
jgi:hypothetical protein